VGTYSQCPNVLSDSPLFQAISNTACSPGCTSIQDKETLQENARPLISSNHYSLICAFSLPPWGLGSLTVSRLYSHILPQTCRRWMTKRHAGGQCPFAGPCGATRIQTGRGLLGRRGKIYLGERKFTTVRLISFRIS
jgi:hypothetical protein